MKNSPITQKAKSIPIIEKDLEKGVVAEANNDMSIYVDEDASPAKKQEAIAHEMVHIDQMQRGELDYDDDNVYWRGKIYPRSKMKEGAKNLPWEKEAWKANSAVKQKSSPAKWWQMAAALAPIAMEKEKELKEQMNSDD